MRPRQDEERIYETALQLFASYGYKKTTLEDIAQELGMTGANLYSYSNSKQSLYHNCVAYALSKWQNYVLDAISGIEDSCEYFTELCRCSIEYLGMDDTFRKILKRDPDIFPMFPEADPYEEINSHSFLMLKNALDRGVGDGTFAPIDTEKTTRILFTIYKTLIIETYIRDDEDSVRESFPEIMDVITKGLLSR